MNPSKKSSKKVGQKVTIKGGRGQKPVTFKEGSLHKILGVPQGQKIPVSKMKAALAGHYGAAAKKKALFAHNMLAKGRKTAQANR